MERAFVALGSNLGNSAALVRRAMDRLQELSSKPVVRSSLWRSSPVDCPPGSGDFINAVAAIHPPAGLSPEALLARLQGLEAEFGRRRKAVLNEARPLDLDLIAWGGRELSTERLILPHPRAHLRKFVLAPLAEIAPNFALPGQKKSVRELLATLRTDESIGRI